MIGNGFHFRKIQKNDQRGPAKNNPPITSNTRQDRKSAHHDLQQEIEEKDSEVLRVKSIFPVDFFPDELIIRKKSVSVIKRGFLTSNIETFLVKDIGLVAINNALIFSQIRISYKAPYEDIVIGTLWKDEAKHAKSLLDKLMLVKNEDINDDVVTYAPTSDMYYRTAS